MLTVCLMFMIFCVLSPSYNFLLRHKFLLKYCNLYTTTTINCLPKRYTPTGDSCGQLVNKLYLVHIIAANSGPWVAGILTPGFLPP